MVESLAKGVFVTGANGFLGSHVADAFVEAGIPVLCQVRPGGRVDNLREAGYDHRNVPLRLDATDSVELLARAVEGAACVVHVAGRSADWGTLSQFHDANVVATRNVCEAARLAGVEHLIVTGSISSYGEEHHPEPKDESCPYAPRMRYPLGGLFESAMNRYRETKAEASLRAMEFGRRHGIATTLLEPTWIFGEREASSGFFEYLDSARVLPAMPGCRTSIFPVVYVRDLARAYVRVCQARPAGVSKFVAGSLHSRTLRETHEAMCRAAGIRPPRMLPRALCAPAGLAMEALWTCLGAKAPPPLTRSRVAMFYDSIPFSAQRFHEAFGLIPETPFEEAVARTVEWYRCRRSQK